MDINFVHTVWIKHIFENRSGVESREGSHINSYQPAELTMLANV